MLSVEVDIRGVADIDVGSDELFLLLNSGACIALLATTGDGVCSKITIAITVTTNTAAAAIFCAVDKEAIFILSPKHKGPNQKIDGFLNEC